MTMGHNGGPPLTFDTCQFFTFDCESVPNFFSCVVSCPDGTELIFEVSDRINQSRQFLAFLRYLVDVSSRNPALYMVGFNNQGYDWPLLNFLLRFQEFGPRDAYAMSKDIISTPWNDRNKHVIWPGKQLIRQLDLQKVHGLSPGGPRSTSLKQLQIAMQLDTVLEYQVDWNADLPHERMPSMLAYNRYDVKSTKAFLEHSRKNIELRLKIGADVGLDLMNLSDVDMGEKIVIDDLEKQQPGITGTRGRGPKRTTVRHSMFLGALVFDYVRFETPEFQRIHQHFMTTTITETKGVFEGVTAQFGGMKWVFGTGGIHAAVPCVTHHATEQRAVITVDVSSYYPSVAVENTLAPEHLGQAFVNVYRTLKERKAEFKALKLKMEETSTKLSANAVFGKGGSKYSCLSDPAFMLGITINGQLLLCMLAEQLAKVPTLEFIQANTDGITLAVDRVHMPQVDAIVQWWQQLTRLNLDYDRWEVVAQRDVNNYLAVEDGGKVKGKGAYEWRIGLDGSDSWHKDQSCKIVTKAVEYAIVSGKPIAQTISECDNAFEFMHTLKVNKSDRVVLGGVLEQYEDTQSPVDAKGKHPMRNKHVGGVDQQHVGRYYVAHRGEPLFKIMKPLAAKPHHFRPQAIEKGHLIAMANDLYDFDWNNLDRSHYIQKAQELLDNTGFNS